MYYLFRPTVFGFVTGLLVWVVIQILFIPVYMVLNARTHPRRQSVLDVVSGSLSTSTGIVLGGIASTSFPGVASLVAGSGLALLFLINILRKYGQKHVSNSELISVVVAIIVALVALFFLPEPVTNW